MTDIERLLAIEAIKRLKSRYFWGLDHKDWDFWRREVWAPDARLIVPEASRECIGIEAVLTYVRESTGDQVSVHHGHMPDIEITSDTTATGVWAMEDRLYRTREQPLEDGSTYLHGFGHYHETYVRLPAGWRIASTRLTRLRVGMFKHF
jgi:SnoaL-like domain